MAETISYRFVMRRGTSSSWTSKNEVLLDGEYGLEKDTGKVKIGDGLKAWNDLPYSFNGARYSAAGSIAIDESDFDHPVISAPEYVAGEGIAIDKTDPLNPVILNLRQSLHLDGSVPAYSNLPTGLTSADSGLTYLVQADKLIYVWDGSAWPISGNGIKIGGGGSNFKIVPYGDLSGLTAQDKDSLIFYKYRDDPELGLSIQPWALWRLDEVTGNFLDASGNGRHLVASANAVRGLESIDKSGLGFAAASPGTGASSVNLIGSYSENTTFGYYCTMMAWIKIPDSSKNNELAGEWFKIGPGGQGFSIGFNSGSTGPASADRYILVGQNSISFRPTNYRFSNSEQIVHFALVWNYSYFRILINGEAVYQSGYIGTYNNITTSLVTVGQGEWAMPSQFKMDRVAIFQGALSDADIKACSRINVGLARGFWDGNQLLPIA